MSEPKLATPHPQQNIQRVQLVDFVCSILQEVLSEQENAHQPTGVDEQTCLLGAQTVLTSLGLVSLIVELEQRLEKEHAVMVTLADERAMSRKNSPFRTVGSLADYIRELLAQE